ncbi:hypothetical protein GCM10023146_31930 [Nocardioides caricicola]
MDSPHWYRRVLPLTALAVGLVALLAALFPGVRDQMALSASHQPQEYVALSFARSSDGTVPVCGGSRTELTVSFTVDNAMSDVRTFDYVVTAGDVRRTGTVAVDPGETADVTQVLARPARDFDLAVRLPGADREVLAHCRGARR